MNTLTLSHIRTLLAHGQWQWEGQDMTCPHEVLIHRPAACSEDEWHQLLLFIDEKHPSTERIETTSVFKHVSAKQGTVIDGYRYWIEPFEDSDRRLCRQKVFDEFDTLPGLPEYHYTDDEFTSVVTYIMQHFACPIFEAGSGDGLFIGRTHIAPQHYQGVDPSEQMIAQCRHDYPSYQVTCCSFEEAVEEWKEQPLTVIATFGAASYIMRPYLQMLAEYNRSYFLMFYAYAYCPEAFQQFHHFNYTDADLHHLFPDAIVREWGHYRIVERNDR